MRKSNLSFDPRGIFWRWFLVFIVMSAIFAFSSLPGSEIPSIFNFQDVFFHVIIYGCLAYFFAKALRVTDAGMHLTSVIVFSTLFGLCYGVSDEWHQLFVPGRSVSGLDIFLDGLGSLLGSKFIR